MVRIEFLLPASSAGIPAGGEQGDHRLPLPWGFPLCKVKESGSNTLSEVSQIECFRSSPWELPNTTSPLVIDSQEQPNSTAIGCFCMVSSVPSAQFFVSGAEASPQGLLGAYGKKAEVSRGIPLLQA